MIKLNDYLYSGDTVLKILRRYSDDLKKSGRANRNQIDILHSNFLLEIEELLEHNEFLTSQSQRIREFYKYMCAEYPFLAFTFKGRIKSLIRSEEKYNGYIVQEIYRYYCETGTYPSVPILKEKLNTFRDLIAYRIVISMPKCHFADGQSRRDLENRYLYRIANALPDFLEDRGFTAISAGIVQERHSEMLDPDVWPYYRDYVANPRETGYESMHITLYDNLARCYIEIQLRTKEMDDFAEIGEANHRSYEKNQEEERARRNAIPTGECVTYDEAYERIQDLQNLDLTKVDVNMFTAYSKHLINDGCGLFRGRLILPYEHLSRFQNDLFE